MRSTPVKPTIPKTANFLRHGSGPPVVLIHGIAASLHDWDSLIPELTKNGYTSYAVDLLGHGDSPKPSFDAYESQWLIEHFLTWMHSLHLTEPAILIGHSFGGYIALEYARRISAWTRGLILVNPFYSRSQLPFLLRQAYSRKSLMGTTIQRLPERMLRFFVDVSSMAFGHSIGAVHSLPEHVRAQTTLDYMRTAPGVYQIPQTLDDLSVHVSGISTPTMVIWGERDQTLSPDSFPRLVSALPRAVGKIIGTGHVPHQSHADDFNQAVLGFLKDL